MDSLLQRFRDILPSFSGNAEIMPKPTVYAMQFLSASDEQAVAVIPEILEALLLTM